VGGGDGIASGGRDGSVTERIGRVSYFGQNLAGAPANTKARAPTMGRQASARRDRGVSAVSYSPMNPWTPRLESCEPGLSGTGHFGSDSEYTQGEKRLANSRKRPVTGNATNASLRLSLSGARCNKLQYTAALCSTLQHLATHCQPLGNARHASMRLNFSGASVCVS